MKLASDGAPGGRGACSFARAGPLSSCGYFPTIDENPALLEVRLWTMWLIVTEIAEHFEISRMWQLPC